MMLSHRTKWKNSLKFYTTKDGFGGKDVRGIVEDNEGNIWFGTSGESANMTVGHLQTSQKRRLIDNDVRSIAIDRKLNSNIIRFSLKESSRDKARICA